jgi:hypothetical protein
MNSDLKTIREDGIRVLIKELGATGTVNFLRQFESGSGNYTEERESILAGITIDEIATSIKNRKES